MRQAPAVGSPLFRATVAPDGPADDAGGRAFRVIASDETVDRYGDVIRAAGWNLEAFRANPVLLFGHKSTEPPVGRVDRIDVDGKRLVAAGHFLEPGINPVADTVSALWSKGYLRAVSVGFMPTKQPNEIKDAQNRWTGGYEFVAQDLLELSVVPVPANPAALSIAKGMLGDRAAILFRDLEDKAAAAVAVARAAQLRTIQLRRLRA